MDLAYVTTYDSTDVRNWSGIGLYLSQALCDRARSFHRIGSLIDEPSLLSKVKQRYYWHFCKRAFLFDREPSVLQGYAMQISKMLQAVNVDVVFSPSTIPISQLECRQPIVFWTDATFGGIINFYPEFSNLCLETIKHGNNLEKAALDKCKLAIYSSSWAAQSAINLYQADPSKVKVVPFGANLACDRNLDDIKAIVSYRKSESCKLLFLGVDWKRKGGDVALSVTKELNRIGLPTELTVVGCRPHIDEPLPDFVKVIEFISKNNPEGLLRINQLLAESHFLILPSIQDCTPVVFSEANSFGLPVISTDVGGIGTIIKDDVNGRAFKKSANTSEYCEYILQHFINFKIYQELCFSSFSEYQTRLNWSVATETVVNLMKDL